MCHFIHQALSSISSIIKKRCRNLKEISRTDICIVAHVHQRSTFLSQFRVILPRFKLDQQDAIDWLAAAHTDADRPDRSEERPEPDYQRMRKLLSRFGCDPSRIQTRYSVLEDFTHLERSKMRIFELELDPSGSGSARRSEVFSEVVNEIFKQFYSEVTLPPDSIVHVTCTGYVSPSGAQSLVSDRQWGRITEVLHAYHMGCYGSLPAIRISRGLLACSDRPNPQVDIVHTELCTLHMNPSLRTPEQLVVQSLFADGLIKYTASKNATGPCLELLALREVIVPESQTSMTWKVGNFGMLMSLARDVPDLVAPHLMGILGELCEPTGMSVSDALATATFAIHPGGPKVIDRIQEALGLAPGQVQASRDILKNHGNMSSATLPHIWKQLLDDPSVPSGQMIFSFAFGPGLTISASSMRKH